MDIDVANGILASYNGSSFINYFNAFGQQWQVYIQAQGEDRASLEKMDGFLSRTRTEPACLSPPW